MIRSISEGQVAESFHLSTRSIPNNQDAEVSQGNSTILIIFIPGNPGTLSFYETFLERLFESANSIFFSSQCPLKLKAVEVVATGHRNHHLEPMDGQDGYKAHNSTDDYQSFNLEDQIEWQLDFCEGQLKRCSNSENPDQRRRGGKVHVVMVGHSIGAYMCLEILSRSSSLSKNLKDIILIMPFIRWKNIPLSHRTKLRLFNSLRPYSVKLALAMVWLYSRLPSYLRIGSVAIGLPKQELDGKERGDSQGKKTMNLNGKNPERLDRSIAIGLLVPRVISNFLRMGCDEIEMVPERGEMLVRYIKVLSCSGARKKRVIGGSRDEDGRHILTKDRGRDNKQQNQSENQSEIDIEEDNGNVKVEAVSSKQVLVIYTTDDVWAPEEDVAAMRAELGADGHGNTVVELIPGLSHGFTLTKRDLKMVCTSLNNHFEVRLKPMLLSEESGGSNTRKLIRTPLIHVRSRL